MQAAMRAQGWLQAFEMSCWAALLPLCLVAYGLREAACRSDMAALGDWQGKSDKLPLFRAAGGMVG